MLELKQTQASSMWVAIINFFGRILPSVKQAILVAWAFFTSRIMEELKQAERQANNDKKIIEADGKINNLDDAAVRDRLRDMAEK